MKEWIVIHQIKALYNQGNGLSERQIAKELGIPQHRQQVSEAVGTSDYGPVARHGPRQETGRLPRLHHSTAANLSGLVGCESAAQVVLP
jgi:hypothetical protein